MNGTLKRRIATATAGSLVLGTSIFGAIALSATSASAYGPTNTTLKCWVYTTVPAPPGDLSSTAATWPDGSAGHTNNGMHLTIAAGPYTAGTPTNVTLAFSEGPKNGPFAVPAETFRVTYKVTTGATSALVTGSPSAPFAVPAMAYGPAGSVTDSVALPTAGSTSIAVETIKFTGTVGAITAVTACNSQTAQNASPGANPYTTPVTTPITDTITVAAGTGSPSPTSTSASPSPTTTSPSPSPTTTSPSPTTTSTPPPGAISGTLSCTTITTTLPWTTTWSASVTGTAVNVTFTLGPKNGPVALQNGWLQPTGTILAGSTSVAVKGPLYGAIPARANAPGATMTGTVSGAPTKVTVSKVIFKDVGSGSMVDTTCVPTATAIVLDVVSAPQLPPTLPASNGALGVSTAPVAGGTVVLTGSGFAPNSAVTAGMYSTPTTLGVGTASSTGAVSVTVTIPSAATGTHTMVLYGTNAAGAPHTLTKSVTVTTATNPTDTPTDPSSTDAGNGGTLPKTGSGNGIAALVWALIALQVGLIVIVRASRYSGRRVRHVGAHVRRH